MTKLTTYKNLYSNTISFNLGNGNEVVMTYVKNRNFWDVSALNNYKVVSSEVCGTFKAKEVFRRYINLYLANIELQPSEAVQDLITEYSTKL